MIVNGKTYVLLGAEGVSEADKAWIREVNDKEEARTVLSSQRLGDGVFLDGTNRPYFLVEVLDSAPAHVLTRAKIKTRVVRLED
jgi:hypothetical protein